MSSDARLSELDDTGADLISSEGSGVSAMDDTELRYEISEGTANPSLPATAMHVSGTEKQGCDIVIVDQGFALPRSARTSYADACFCCQFMCSDGAMPIQWMMIHRIRQRRLAA